MKIKKIGWTSFLINSGDINVMTDPLMLDESGIKFPKTQSDICLFTHYNKDIKEGILVDNKLDEKVVKNIRENIMEISGPGEYEIGGVMVRRDVGTDFYLIDENTIRVLYLGGTDGSFNPDKVKDVGDVDVLILPIGNGKNFMPFEKLSDVISNVDPAILIPCAYKEDGKDDSLKTKEEFIKYFGYVNAREETTLNVTKRKVEEEEQSSVDVIFLK